MGIKSLLRNPINREATSLLGGVPFLARATEFIVHPLKQSPMNREATFVRVVLLFVVILFSSPAFAQFEEYNHPELVWQTIETAHCFVHFHNGTERTARELVGIAEAVYDPITKLYDYEPDTKVHWIVRDHDDYSNGGTYYYDNKIVIWATPLDFELRGTHNWLYDVVTHEFTHLIQLGASRKGPRWMPGVYFQFIGYEPERRPDVLYGYPNRIMSWPVAGTIIPMWFAEGTAQFQARGLNHDWWDSHRDMMIRVRALGGNLLTLDQMTVFGKSSMGSELVYCQGYALTRFIANAYGDDVLAKLSQEMGGVSNWNFDAASKQTLGLDQQGIYNEWRKSISTDYSHRTEVIRTHLSDRKVVRDDGFGNLYPAFSADGKRLAFVSNKGRDYLSTAKLVIYETEKDTITETKCPAISTVSWSPDGKFLAYSRQGEPNGKGSHFDDLYLWNLEKEKETRLTKSSRLSAPSYSPDGKSLIAVMTTDGTQNLALLGLPAEVKGKDLSDKLTWRLLTHFKDGRQIFRPRFSPDGKSIVCATSDLGTRDIYRFDLSSERFEPLISTDVDERDPVISRDGKFLYYACDRTGIFNLYRRNLESGRDEAISNVIGGAFMPTLTDNGSVGYAEFTSKGYGVYLINEPEPVEPVGMVYLGGDVREDVKLPPHPVADNPAIGYSTPFGKLAVLPRLAWDYGKFKPGFYAYTNDFLEKLSLFGGFQMNGQGDRDAYLNAEYRHLYPTLFLEVFNIVRTKGERFDDPYVIVGDTIINGEPAPIYGKYNVDYRFNLSEFDIGVKLPIRDAISATGTVRLSTYKSALKFDDGGTFDYTYLRGKAYILRLEADYLMRSAGMDIHPLGGWTAWLEAAHENNRFIEGFEIDADKLTLLEVYKPYNYQRFEAEGDYYHTLFDSKVVLNPRLMAGAVTRTVDPFFHLYAGGLTGMRGYSFYSLGGTARATGRLSLRFPILEGIDQRLGVFYFDRVNGALFAEAGNIWRSGEEFGSLKKDIGAELRMKMFSWYGFPTDVQFTAAYGLDRFTVTEGDISQAYGKEWRYYFTLLFGFI